MSATRASICQGTTKRKKPCRKRTIHSSGFCIHHRTTATTAPIASIKPIVDPEECAICLEDIDNSKECIKPSAFGCRHADQFHLSCIKQCFNQLCPLCRSPHQIGVTGKPPEPIQDIPPELAPPPPAASAVLIIRLMGGGEIHLLPSMIQNLDVIMAADGGQIL